MITIAGSPIHQRGPDGYAVGSDKWSRLAYGQIRPAEFFQRNNGRERPMFVFGWAWSTNFQRWSAYVLWYDGTETFTYPIHP